MSQSDEIPEPGVKRGMQQRGGMERLERDAWISETLQTEQKPERATAKKGLENEEVVVESLGISFS